MKQRIEQQAQQLELAAQLLRTGHPWTTSAGTPNPNYHIAYFLNAGIEIRNYAFEIPTNADKREQCGRLAVFSPFGYSLSDTLFQLVEGYLL